MKMESATATLWFPVFFYWNQRKKFTGDEPPFLHEGSMVILLKAEAMAMVMAIIDQTITTSALWIHIKNTTNNA